MMESQVHFTSLCDSFSSWVSVGVSCLSIFAVVSVFMEFSAPLTTVVEKAPLDKCVDLFWCHWDLWRLGLKARLVLAPLRSSGCCCGLSPTRSALRRATSPRAAGRAGDVHLSASRLEMNLECARSYLCISSSEWNALPYNTNYTFVTSKNESTSCSQRKIRSQNSVWS